MPEYLTTADVAELLNTDTWRVRRLFEDGTLAEPGRLGNQRAIPCSMLPAIIDGLRERGWLSQSSPSQSEECAVEGIQV